MYTQQEFTGDNAPQNNSKNIESFVNQDMNPIGIYDFIDPVYTTNKQLYEITERVFKQYRKSFDMYDQQHLKLNHFELFEWTYKTVESTVNEILRTKYKTIDDLMVINLNTLTMFLQPNEITDEENEWVNRLTKNRTGEYELEIKLPEDAERNYYINFKRVLDENNENPDFNESILNFFDRTRDLN